MSTAELGNLTPARQRLVRCYTNGSLLRTEAHDTEYVYGPLQVPDYSRWVIEKGGYSSEEDRRWILETRPRLLGQVATGAGVIVIQDANVLRDPTVPPAILDAQLESLQGVIEENREVGAIRVGVVPFDTEVPPRNLSVPNYLMFDNLSEATAGQIERTVLVDDGTKPVMPDDTVYGRIMRGRAVLNEATLFDVGALDYIRRIRQNLQ